MNVIHQLESDFSSDINGFVTEDCYNDDHQENESDIATTSSVSIESDCSTRSGNFAVPLLSVLKAPDV